MLHVVEPPPEHATGSQIEVWRHGDDVVACEVKEELGRGAQAVVYRVESEGAVRALKVARMLAIADEARVMAALAAKMAVEQELENVRREAVVSASIEMEIDDE